MILYAYDDFISKRVDIINSFLKIKVIMQKPLPNYSLSSESFTVSGSHMAGVKMMELSNILLKPKGVGLQRY